jgi:GT2 family glycosyltransferase
MDIEPREGTPRVSVCLPTRDRGATIAAALASLRNLDHDSFEVLVVDQSLDDRSRRAYDETVGNDPRFAYLPSATIGKSVACNLALGHVRGRIVAFTDDDCVVPPDWLTKMERALSQNPGVAVVCGGLRPGRGPEEGFIPWFVPSRPKLHRSRWAIVWCTGANLIVRTEALRDISGFDEVLGPGAPLKAGEEADFVYRLLRAGHPVLELPEPAIIHYGLRQWGDEARDLLRAYAMSWGAVWMKHLRMGDSAVLPSLVSAWFGVVRWHNLLRLRRPNGLGSFAAFAGGMLASFRYPIDRASRVYMSSAPTGKQLEG